MSDPDFAFRTDEDARSWALYRQTETQERPVAACTRDETLWFALDRADGNVDREPVRGAFLDAVGLAFYRGPSLEEWVTEPVFEELTWYESECLDELRELRNEAMSSRRPDADGRSMPSEAWDLVSKARSHFTLTDSRAFRLGEGESRERGERPDETALADFE